MDAARLALVRASEALREAEGLLADSEARVARASEAYLAETRQAIESEAVRRHRNWIAAEESRAAALRRERDRRRNERGRAAEAERNAAAAMKVLERLRDRAWHRYLAEERRAETKQIDELAAQQFARRREARSR
jgi:flagellar export protein FliJ